MKTKQNGFTIIELIIVILVVGGLTGLVIASFSSLKQKDRDNERQNDIKTLHAQVESYFAQAGKYPTLANLNDEKWRATSMKGLDADVLRDPQALLQALADKPARNVYSYTVKASDDTECDNNAKDCTKYTLSATYESGGVFTKSNLN